MVDVDVVGGRDDTRDKPRLLPLLLLMIIVKIWMMMLHHYPLLTLILSAMTLSLLRHQGAAAAGSVATGSISRQHIARNLPDAAVMVTLSFISCPTATAMAIVAAFVFNLALEN